MSAPSAPQGGGVDGFDAEAVAWAYGKLRDFGCYTSEAGAMMGDRLNMMLLEAAQPRTDAAQQGEVVAWPERMVNLPCPDGTSDWIIGFRVPEGDPILGDFGLSEPLAWFRKVTIERTAPPSAPAPSKCKECRGSTFESRYDGSSICVECKQIYPQPAAPESIRDWSLRMAEREAGQNVSAGAHGIADDPAAPAPVAGDAVARARETLAAEYERSGMSGAAFCVRSPSAWVTKETGAVLRAIKAALAQQPAAVDEAICPVCERLTDIRHCQACGCDFTAGQQPAAVGDTRRLEWLIANELLAHRLSDTGQWMITNADLSPAIYGGEYDTPREAIDAGIAALAGQQQGGDQ